MRPRILIAAAMVMAAVLGGTAAPAMAQQQACDTGGLSPGSYTAMVEGIQRELAINGFDPGGLDGRLGPRTREAIRQYQRMARLPVTGCPSEALLQHVSFHLPKIYAVDRPEMPTQQVEIQEALTRRGYYLGAVDGIIGPRTRAAIREFQRDANLPVTGEADQELLQKLREDQSIRRMG